MTMDQRQELLEIYKLHAQLADSVSRQRAAANRFYLLLMSGLTVVLSALLQSRNGLPLSLLLLSLGFLGASLSTAWYIHIRSFRQLNTGKFKALHELEKKLAYPFFTREWKLLKEGKCAGNYWKLSVVETFVPGLFFAASLAMLAIGIFHLV